MAIGQKKFVINPVNSDSPDENGNNHEYIIVPTRILSVFFHILIISPSSKYSAEIDGLGTMWLKSLSNNFTPMICAVCAPMYF